MAINNFTDGELLTAPRMNEMVEQLNTRYYTIDQTAGRVFKAWDYLNNREQIIYGDTGWRNIQLLGGATGTCRIRRVGNAVDIYIYEVTGPAGTFDFMAPPDGFRPPFRATGLYDRWLLFTSPLTSDPLIRRAQAFGSNIRYYNGAAGESFSGHITYFTDDTWPTTLPGVAA